MLFVPEFRLRKKQILIVLILFSRSGKVMFARAPKLFRLVLIAACSVGVAVILTMWRVNGISDRVLTGIYHKLKKYILLDVLLCSIAEYFYELCRILTSP